jgi:hypothetical protein
MASPRKKKGSSNASKSIDETSEQVAETGLENSQASTEDTGTSNEAEGLGEESKQEKLQEDSPVEFFVPESDLQEGIASESIEGAVVEDSNVAVTHKIAPSGMSEEDSLEEIEPIQQSAEESPQDSFEEEHETVDSVEEPFNGEASLKDQSDASHEDELQQDEAEPSSEVPLAAKPIPFKRPNLFVLFWRWITSRFKRRTKIEGGQLAPLDVFDEAWVKSAAAEIRALQNQRIAASNSAENIQNQISQLEQEQVRIETWLEGLKRSYYWKLEQRMEQNVGQAKSDIAEYESLVRALELPEKGTLRALRERFHKGLLINFLTFSVPTFLLYFVPWFSRVDLFSWIVGLLRSPLFILLVVTIGAIVAGVFLLLRKVAGPKKVPLKKTFKWTAISMLIPALVYALFRFKDFLLIFVTPLIEQVRPTALWVILILFTFLTLALLIVYYQGWSVFRRVVTEEMSRLDNVVAGYVKTRQELGRLQFLNGQTIDWMKLLAHTLYRPWKIHPDWKSPNQARAVSESFPMALRVAQAVENDASESAQLRRTIANRLLVQGWRTAAFESSLSQIGSYLGYEPDKVNPELLDSDLPHQPNNSRKLVLEYFEHSAETDLLGTLDLSNKPADPESVGSKPLPSDVYLVEVARGQLKYLIKTTQGSALAQARPSVQQIVSNPLSDLTDSEIETKNIEVSDWDQFLAEGLGIEDQTQPPIGVLAFTNEGRKSKSPEGVTSQVLVPGRFAASLPVAASENLKVVPLEGREQNQPAELMLRFDVVGPLPFNHVTLIQNASLVRFTAPAPEEQNDDL